MKLLYSENAQTDQKKLNKTCRKWTDKKGKKWKDKASISKIMVKSKKTILMDNKRRSSESQFYFD